MEFRPCRGTEVEALCRLEMQAFHTPNAIERRWVDAIRPENFRVVADGAGGLAAAASSYDLGLAFGQMPLPCRGYGGVAVAPERRGTGVGRRLLTELLREARADGFPLSALYPASWSLYRKFGWDLAGLRCTWEVPAAALPAGGAGLAVRAVEREAALPELERLRTACAGAWGNLRRDAIHWRIMDVVPDNPVRYYLLEADGRAAGYLGLRNGDAPRSLFVMDHALPTPEARRQALALLAAHRLQIDAVRWAGAPDDPMVHGLAENDAKLSRRDQWMLRLVDPAAAFAGRAFHPGARGGLTLRLRDDILPENDGLWRLTVADGRGTLERIAADGPADLDGPIGGFSGLFTGHLSVETLAGTDRLRGSGAALQTAQALFACPRPWMMEYF